MKLFKIYKKRSLYAYRDPELSSRRKPLPREWKRFLSHTVWEVGPTKIFETPEYRGWVANFSTRVNGWRIVNLPIPWGRYGEEPIEEWAKRAELNVRRYIAAIEAAKEAPEKGIKFFKFPNHPQDDWATLPGLIAREPGYCLYLDPTIHRWGKAKKNCIYVDPEFKVHIIEEGAELKFN